MQDGTSDRLRLVFPASAPYRRLGRVTVAGLALRLGVDVGAVENLRLAVDGAAGLLAGDGSIELEAEWQPGLLQVTLTNDTVVVDPARVAELAGELSPLVDEVTVSASSVVLGLRS